MKVFKAGMIVALSGLFIAQAVNFGLLRSSFKRKQKPSSFGDKVKLKSEALSILQQVLNSEVAIRNALNSIAATLNRMTGNEEIQRELSYADKMSREAFQLMDKIRPDLTKVTNDTIEGEKATSVLLLAKDFLLRISIQKSRIEQAAMKAELLESQHKKV